jgi:hypothetical protein
MKRFRMILGLAAAILAVAGLSGTTPAQDPVAADCGTKVCRPVCETKTVTTKCYSSKCEEFCLPPCSPLSCLFGGCAECGRVRTKRLLVVKLQKSEVQVTKCVPTAECAGATCAPVGAAVVTGPAPVAAPATVNAMWPPQAPQAYYPVPPQPGQVTAGTYQR